MRITALKVLGNRVLVRPDEAESTQGGIYLPESAKKKPQFGIVVAVGEGRRLDNGSLVAPDVKEGDHVMFAKYGGTEIKSDGEELIIIDADMIYATLEDDE